MSDWTEEELQQLPSTTMVFDAPALVVNNHDWTQEGYMMSDTCNPSRIDCQRVGIPIGVGKLLIKDQKGYHIVDEVTRK